MVVMAFNLENKVTFEELAPSLQKMIGDSVKKSDYDATAALVIKVYNNLGTVRVTIGSGTGAVSSPQNESPAVAPVDTTPQRPKVARARRGKQTNVQPIIEAGSGEWDMMVRYAEFYNDHPDENRITVVLNPDIKRALDIIRINCRQFNFGNILNAVCRTFIERNKEQIQRMQKDKGGIL